MGSERTRSATQLRPSGGSPSRSTHSSAGENAGEPGLLRLQRLVGNSGVSRLMQPEAAHHDSWGSSDGERTADGWTASAGGDAAEQRMLHGAFVQREDEEWQPRNDGVVGQNKAVDPKDQTVAGVSGTF